MSDTDLTGNNLVSIPATTTIFIDASASPVTLTVPSVGAYPALATMPVITVRRVDSSTNVARIHTFNGKPPRYGRTFTRLPLPPCRGRSSASALMVAVTTGLM